MNRIQKNKLLMSKWTAVEPKNFEKHFLVTRIVDDETSERRVVLEAVHSKTEYVLLWTELKNADQWRIGWR